MVLSDCFGGNSLIVIAVDAQGSGAVFDSPGSSRQLALLAIQKNQQKVYSHISLTTMYNINITSNITYVCISTYSIILLYLYLTFAID